LHKSGAMLHFAQRQLILKILWRKIGANDINGILTILQPVVPQSFHQCALPYFWILIMYIKTHLTMWETSVEALRLQGFLDNLLKGKKCRKVPYFSAFYHTIGGRSPK
jgi:hypothetical protein